MVIFEIEESTSDIFCVGFRKNLIIKLTNKKVLINILIYINVLYEFPIY